MFVNSRTYILPKKEEAKFSSLKDEMSLIDSLDYLVLTNPQWA
jgi:hypothetical protein